ncbi:MAG: hypothetical protein RR515_03270 [Clostridium sp.]
MKKLLPLILIILFLTSCSYFVPSGNGEKISPPTNSRSPIYGVWNITKSLSSKTSTFENDLFKDILTNNITITQDYFVLGKLYWQDISYKTKLVNLNDYYNSIGVPIPNLTKGNSNEVNIFSIIYNSNPICDITIINNTTGILYISGGLYEIKRLSTDTTVDTKKLTPINNKYLKSNHTTPSKSGVMIGLKTPVTDQNGNKVLKYRTLWLSKSTTSLNPIYEIDTIMFPRKSDFWTLSESTITNNGVTENIFIPNDISQSQVPPTNPSSLVTEQSIHDYKDGYIKKELNYLCNDYISVELTGSAMKNGLPETINKLHIYPISSLPFEKSVSMEDIFKGTSVEFLRNEFFTALESIQGNVTFIDSNEQSQNLGITRRDSHWLFTGRIGYLNNDSNKLETLDYNLNALPPPNIVVYDNLFMPFIKIKKAVPSAIDSFSSPNNSMAVIVSDHYLYVYDIVNTPLNSLSLSDKYLTKIKLNPGESVIMSEWAVGEYVNTWNNIIKSYDKSRIIKK